MICISAETLFEAVGLDEFHLRRVKEREKEKRKEVRKGEETEEALPPPPKSLLEDISFKE